MARVLSERLAAVRKKRGIRQADLAEMVGMDKSAISKIERDVNSADAELLARLCRALNISADYLTGLTEIDRGPGVSELDTALLASYYAAPAEIKGIVDHALAPYKQVEAGGRAAS